MEILESGSANCNYNIQWEITYNCNYNCKYCQVKNIIKNKYNDIKHIDMCIKNINSIFDKKNSIFILITGGEPTLHPDILYIIKSVNGIYGLKEFGLHTNLSLDNIKLLDILNVIKDKNIFNLFCSYHSKFIKDEIFLNKINILEQNNIKYHIALMLEHNEYDNIYKFINKYLNLYPDNINKIKIQPLEPIEKQNYNKKYIDLENMININSNDQEKIYYLIKSNNNIYKEEYFLSEMKKLPLFYHSFKGMNCYKYNHLRINPYGFISNRCEQKKSLDNIFLMNDINKFKEKINKPFICKNLYCSNRDDIRFIKKFKNEKNN